MPRVTRVVFCCVVLAVWFACVCSPADAKRVFAGKAKKLLAALAKNAHEMGAGLKGFSASVDEFPRDEGFFCELGKVATEAEECADVQASAVACWPLGQ